MSCSSSLFRMEVFPLEAEDGPGHRMLERARLALEPELGQKIHTVRKAKAYTLDGLSCGEKGKEEALFLFRQHVLYDPLLQSACLADGEGNILAGQRPSGTDWGANWYVEVAFRPGVTDNEGKTAAQTAWLALNALARMDSRADGEEEGKEGSLLAANEQPVQHHTQLGTQLGTQGGMQQNAVEKPRVYTSLIYSIEGDLTRAEVELLASSVLANDLIERVRIKDAAEWQKGFTAQSSAVVASACHEVRVVPLSEMDDAALMALSRDGVLALSLEEMRTIRDWFQLPQTKALRAPHFASMPEAVGNPTDVELEMLAQTWSEHCKHKIFAAKVQYTDTTTGKTETINSLYKSCIQAVTAQIRYRLGPWENGQGDFCRSVFKDNAGVVAFNDAYDICIKVETHNSPSALDPYGGALTGIVGVNRDPMGTGMGAELVCNTDVFCFASPFRDIAKNPLPPRLLHPRRIMEGVAEGVEHGGNKSGVPTVNGSIVFDERYLGKPLVYCGTVGLLPASLHGKPGYEKKACVGDAIVMVGGRIGKDGIHGATFSSEELHEGSPATAVQIGDPITQRKMYDFLLRARDTGLYNAITDNGAGGLSSSIGEMAEDTNGASIDLAMAPLKYDGLRPWEILLSEAQERMTLAVPKEKLEDFCRLANHMDVEATCLGTYTDSGLFYATYAGNPCACLSMEFLHKGLPQATLEAVWEGAPGTADIELEPRLNAQNQEALLLNMLGRLNICSKENIIRQYDHEVKGGSVIKPLCGVEKDAPADAAVLRPVLGKPEAIVLSHGICPKFSDADTYWMAANAIDEAVRNAVAVGADPDRMAGVDNFCWPDPVYAEKTPDGRHKMAQLVRACKALAHFCAGFGVPCVSGKDSMKNDYTGGGAKISIPPTLLFSILGYMPDAKKAISSDFKAPDHIVYILGETKRELGGSEIAGHLGITLHRVPQVDEVSALARYRALHKAINLGLVSACHDLSDGGLAVALAEMCIGGRLGAGVDIARVPATEDINLTELLYAESASRLLVTVPQKHIEAFEALFAGQVFAKIGITTLDPVLHVDAVTDRHHHIFTTRMEDMVEAFKKPLGA